MAQKASPSAGSLFSAPLRSRKRKQDKSVLQPVLPPGLADFPEPETDDDSDEKHNDHPPPRLPFPPTVFIPLSSIPAPASFTAPTSSVTVLADSYASFTQTTFTTSTKTHMYDESSSAETSITETIPASTVYSTKSPTLTTANTGGLLIPSNKPMSSYSKGHKTEEKKAAGTVVVIICVFVFVGMCYVCFRFCPPVRKRYLAWRARRIEERQKRLGIEDLPPTVVVTGPPQGEGWTTAGPNVSPAAVRRLGLRSADEARRPPSYRSYFTASGASWVANGFRLPDRVSRTRRSNMSGRRWFGRSDGPASDTTSMNARLSSMSSGSQRESGGRLFDGSVSPQTRMSLMSEVSGMSSRWSEQRRSVALRPPALPRKPVVVARESGRGMM